MLSLKIAEYHMGDILDPPPPPGKNLFLFPAFRCHLNYGSHNFRYKITEHSRAKITPALQARLKYV